MSTLFPSRWKNPYPHRGNVKFGYLNESKSKDLKNLA